MYVTQWPETISTTICKKAWVKEKKKYTGFQMETNRPLREMFLQPPAGIKDLYACFWSVQKCLQFFTTQKIQKQNRSEIPSSNPLLPLSNYSLPADKLQVCGVCLRLLGYNRWSTACVCWAGCQSLTGSVSQVHISLPGTTNILRESRKNSLISFFLFKCTAQKISQEGRYYLCNTENL